MAFFNGGNNHKHRELQRRIQELEDIIEKCSQAFDLLPITAIEKGVQWFPSEEAIHRLRRAKDGVRDYLQDRYHGEKKG